MKSTITFFALAALAASTLAESVTLPVPIFRLLTPFHSTSMPMSTLTVHPACPSAPPANEMVTRSAVNVPSCAAGNATEPMIVSVSGDVTMTMTGGGPMMTPSMSMSGKPPQFTGGAARKGVVGGAVVLGGVVAALVV